MKNLVTRLLALLMFFVLSACKKNTSSNDDNEQQPNTELNAQVITQQLTQPWEILWGPDSQLWITERGGRISRVNPANGQVTLLLTVADVSSVGEGGLLGMVLSPDFAANLHVFVAYNYSKSGTYTEKIVRYTFGGNALTNPVTIMDNIPAASTHNGCRLAIGPDGKLYITTGDAQAASQAQNMNSLSGKILRINLDGSIPADNPVASNPVWSLGHRNAQGLVFANNRLYSSEHGNSTDDEINIIRKGMNYGWPNVEGECSGGSETQFCMSANLAGPIQTWTPTIAPSGMDYYNSNTIPQWKNSLLLAVLKNSELLQLKLNGNGDRIESVKSYYKSTYGRLRDVCVAPDGKVYLITGNGSNDKIIAVSPQ
jgi:aldose sugar dehydrogenase